MHDLIIDDDANETQKDQIKELADGLESIISDYIRHLDSITTNAIKSGKAHDSLVAFKELATQLCGCYSKLSAATYLAFDNFKSDSDSADKYLYDA